MVADLLSHFPEFVSQREQLRSAMLNHDAKYRDLVDRTGDGFSITKAVGNDDSGVRRSAAIALVDRCSRERYGVRFETDVNSHSYSYSAGGGGSNSGQPVPVGIVAIWDAFRSYKPDASFNSACSELKRSVDDLGARFAKLADEALVLSQVSTSSGDCRYLR